MQAFFKSFARRAGYVVAAFILIAAVVICLLRFLAPIVNQHKNDLEKLASQFLQTPVSIQNVSVSWYQYQPIISLHNVAILDKDSKSTLLKIKNVSILISISSSIWNREIITSGIMVSGANLNIEESATGDYTVQELSSLPLAQQTNQKTAKFADMMGWISKEPRLILHDINFHYTGFTGKKRFVTLLNINIENNDALHTIGGKAVLHQELPTEIMLSSQWTGKVFDPAKIKAKVYLYVSGLSLAQWAKDYSWKDWQIKNGIVSAKIWATWDKDSFQKIQSNFQAYGVSLFSNADKSSHKINRLSGNIGWKRDGNNLIIAGDDILLDIPTHLWPSVNFYISATRDVKDKIIFKSINVGYVDLTDVQTFLNSSPSLLPDETKKILQELKLSGELQHTNIIFANNWNDWQHTSLNTHFNVSFAAWKKYPGIKNFNGSLKWANSQGEVKIHSLQTVLQLNSIFNNDIQLQELSGNIQFQYNANHDWLFNISSLQLFNSDIAANLNGKINLISKQSPNVDITTNLIIQKVENISHYLPAKILDKDLKEWLENSFISGSIESARVILRGSLKDFPFDKKNGEFSASTNIKNIDLRFAPKWPVMKNLNGSLKFTGRTINIDVDSAEMMNISLTGIHAVIPYIGENKPTILQVKANPIQTTFPLALKYVHASPLEESVGKIFSDVDMQGDVTLIVGLTVPLSDTDKTQAKGSISFKDSLMNMPLWNLKLNHLNGDVQFTDATLNAKNIKAELFDKPFQFNLITKQINLTTKQKTKTLSVVEAQFDQQLYLNDLEKWLQLPSQKIIEGETNVKGTIDFSLTSPLEIHLNSNLAGVTINFDKPYGKKIQELKKFSADIILEKEKPLRLKLNYGDVNSAIILDRKDNQYKLIAAVLGFGKTKVDWPETPGLYITGQFDLLDWDKIKKYLNDAKGKSSLSIPQLKEIDIRANKIIAGGQSLNQVRLHASPKQNNWIVNINSSEVVGQLTLPTEFNKQQFVTAQIQKIDMHSSLINQKNILFDIKSFPSISFVANDVNYNDMKLGKLIFKATPNTDGLTIQTLQIVSPNIDLRSQGTWKQDANGYTTRLSGHANSLHVNQLLKNFGVDVSNIVVNKGDLNFFLSWRDAPYSPSVTSLNGQASLSLGEGRIVDIGKENGAKMSIGRMLNIFSLQTIPRRLSLDFSDVTQKGYSFDSIRGDFSIKDGDLFTKNLRFDGPVAKIDINGRIGLAKKDYNFILSVTANVTSSIPLAATLLTGNPLIGLGALAVNSIIGSQVSKVTTNYYSVTGSWSNPTWKSVGGTASQKK